MCELKVIFIPNDSVGQQCKQVCCTERRGADSIPQAEDNIVTLNSPGPWGHTEVRTPRATFQLYSAAAILCSAWLDLDLWSSGSPEAASVRAPLRGHLFRSGGCLPCDQPSWFWQDSPNSTDI